MSRQQEIQRGMQAHTDMLGHCAVAESPLRAVNKLYCEPQAGQLLKVTN